MLLVVLSKTLKLILLADLNYNTQRTNMYDINSLLTEVVTVKTTPGLEIIARLIGYDEKKFTLTLENPKLIVLSETEVATIPFVFTAEPTLLYLTREQYIAVYKSASMSAEDYTNQVSNTTPAEV